MKMNKKINKSKSVFVMLLIIFSLSAFISHSFIWAMKLNAWVVTFWNIDISPLDIDVSYENILVYWNIKSWFIENNRLYLQYYYPFQVFVHGKENILKKLFYSDNTRYSKYTSVYEKYLYKEDIDYRSEPYYLVYDKKTDELFFLNAEKNIIEWKKSLIDFELLKKLDKTTFVKIDTIDQQTSFDLSDKKNIKSMELLKKLNNYLNLQINK